MVCYQFLNTRNVRTEEIHRQICETFDENA